MRMRDIFELAVRLLGLVFLYHGLVALPTALPMVWTSMLGVQLVGLLFGIAVAVWPLLVAYWLLGGAQLLVRMAYPEGISASTMP